MRRTGIAALAACRTAETPKGAEMRSITRRGPVAALTLLALTIAPPAAAQFTGVPVINNPHTPAGPLLHGLVTFPDARGGGGYGVAGGFQYGVGRFAFGVSLGARNPSRDLSFPDVLTESVEGYAVYGGTAALRLVGSPTSPFAAALQVGAGFEDPHRVAGDGTMLTAPSRKTFVATLGVGLRVEAGGVALDPWAAVGPRLAVHDADGFPPCLRCFVQLGAAGRVVEQRETATAVGVSGGVDVSLSRIIGVRFAIDLAETTVPLVLAQTTGGIVWLDATSSSLQTTALLVGTGVTIRIPQ